MADYIVLLLFAVLLVGAYYLGRYQRDRAAGRRDGDVEEQRRADEQHRFDELERAQHRIWHAASPDVAANSDLFLHHCHPESHHRWIRLGDFSPVPG